MKLKRLVWVFPLLWVMSLGCQPRLLWWRGQPSEYQAALQKWSRSKKAYQGVKTLLLVGATYQHLSVRRAYVLQYIADHNLSQQKEKELLAQQEAQAAERVEFIVSAFSDEDEWQKLEKDSSIWTVYLVNDKNERVKPQRIEYLEDAPVYIRTYYPHVTPLTRVYRIIFPSQLPSQDTPLLGDQTRPFSLEFLSAVAQLKLEWNQK